MHKVPGREMAPTLLFLDKVLYYSYDVKWRVVLGFDTESGPGQTFLKIEINEHCTLHMYFL